MAFLSRNHPVGLEKGLVLAAGVEKGVVIAPKCPKCGSGDTKTLTRSFSTMVLCCQQCGERWIEDVRR